jgi:hypothetical protein
MAWINEQQFKNCSGCGHLWADHIRPVRVNCIRCSCTQLTPEWAQPPAVSGVSQGPVEKWREAELRTGHVYSGGRTGPLRDGYATCRLCGTHENEKAILLPCPQNPLSIAEASGEKAGEGK